MNFRNSSLCLVLNSLLIAPAHAALEVDLLTTKADFSIWGGAVKDSVRSSTTADLNDDGFPDLVIGGDLWQDLAKKEKGRVCIYWGPLSFLSEHDLLTETPPFCITGNKFDLGYSVHAQDLDGDGIADLEIGGWSAGPDGTRQNAGGVAVFLGRKTWPAALTESDADWMFYGANQDQLQDATVGDINGDGHPDLVLLAVVGDIPLHLSRAYVFLGPSSAWTKKVYDLASDTPSVVITTTVTGIDGFGWYSTTGDIIGDSTTDLIIANLRSGSAVSRTYVFKGRASWPAAMTTDDADLTIRESMFQSEIAAVAVGDWNGDGRDDLVVGAAQYTVPSGPQTGAVFVFYGRSTFPSTTWNPNFTPADATIIGPQSGSLFGLSVAVADVNGDGYLDILAGAPFDRTPYSRPQAGAVHVISGCPGPQAVRDLAVQPADLSIYGAYSGDNLSYFNNDLSARDLDSDGRADIFVGTPLSMSLDHARPFNSGETHVVLGRNFDGVPPGDIGNTLRAVKSGLNVDLSWAPDAASSSYALFRATVTGSWPPPLETRLATPAASEPDVAAADALYFYRVVGENCAGFGP